MDDIASWRVHAKTVEEDVRLYAVPLADASNAPPWGCVKVCCERFEMVLKKTGDVQELAAHHKTLASLDLMVQRSNHAGCGRQTRLVSRVWRLGKRLYV